MCYTAGPRCLGHAQEDVENLKTKRDETYESYNKVLGKAYTSQSDYERLKDRPGADQQIVKLYKKSAERYFRQSEKERTKLTTLSQKYDAAKKEANATAGGIENLKEEIAILEEKGEDTRPLREDLREAEQTYNVRMEKYDSTNQTVFGRKPSPYGYDEGIDTLRERLKKNEARLASLHKDELVNDNDNRAKIERANEASRRLKNQLEHAYATDKRVSDGIIKTHKRPPAKPQARYSNGDELKKPLNAEKLTSTVQQFLSAYPGVEVKIKKGYYREQTEFHIEATVPGHKATVGNRTVAKFSLLDNETTPENVERYMKRFMRFERN